MRFSALSGWLRSRFRGSRRCQNRLGAVRALVALLRSSNRDPQSGSQLGRCRALKGVKRNRPWSMFFYGVIATLERVDSTKNA